MNNSELVIRDPAPPPGASGMTLRGLRFRGRLLDVDVGAGRLTVTLRAAPPGAAAPPLTIAAATGPAEPLRPGAAESFEAAGAVITIAAAPPR